MKWRKIRASARYCDEQSSLFVQDNIGRRSGNLFQTARSARFTCTLSGRKPLAERPKQVLESVSFFRDAIFVTAPIFLPGMALRNPMYKIYTLLSTGFVENLPRGDRGAARKPLPDAGFRGVPRLPQ